MWFALLQLQALEASRLANAQKKVTKAAAQQAADMDQGQDNTEGQDNTAKKTTGKGKTKPEVDPEKWASTVSYLAQLKKELLLAWGRLCRVIY